MPRTIMMMTTALEDPPVGEGSKSGKRKEWKEEGKEEEEEEEEDEDEEEEVLSWQRLFIFEVFALATSRIARIRASSAGDIG